MGYVMLRKTGLPSVWPVIFSLTLPVLSRYCLSVDGYLHTIWSVFGVYSCFLTAICCWGLIMGIPPDAPPSVDYVTLVISGMEKKPSTPAFYPEPGNGSYVLEITAYGYFEVEEGDWRWRVWVNTGYVTLEGAYKDGGFFRGYCYEDYYHAPADFVSWSFVGTNLYYTGCTATVGVYQISPKPSIAWLVAPLVGVPSKEGYFAEDLETVIASRKVRFANHFDGTNVKVYMEP